MALAGVWRLKKRGSGMRISYSQVQHHQIDNDLSADYVPGVEDIPGVPFITQMVSTWDIKNTAEL